MSHEPPIPPSAPSLRVTSLSSETRPAAIRLSQQLWDRPTDATYLAWRYADAPTQEATLAMVGEECVATMFGLRRTYRTPNGDMECVEPFEWFATERSRASGAGLRVVKSLMAGERPLVTLGGTPAASALFRRLGWTLLCEGQRWVLPLRGAYLRARGRSRTVSGAFDQVVRHYFTPRARSDAPVSLHPVPTVSSEILAIAQAQRRFEWMRIPDRETQAWLTRAPLPMGRYSTSEVLLDGQVVGWVILRAYRAGGFRHGDIQEVFLADDAREWYEATLRAASRLLLAETVDAITCVTTCPDTLDALRRLRFRHDDDEPVFAWHAGTSLSTGPALVNGAHADRAFFPLPTAAEARQDETGAL